MKRTLSILLALLLVFGMFGTAFATDIVEDIVLPDDDS